MRAVCILLLFFSLLSEAQERCAVNHIAANAFQIRNKDGFEKWINERLEEKRAVAGSRWGINSKQQQVYEIPVVFHVVHDGSPVGSGSNISDARIAEQLEILNQDFRRQNADASDTPPAFLPVAADTEIQFVMARQDPEGLPTNGIVRVAGSQKTYNPDNDADDMLLKSESRWSPEDYVNIYVTDLSGGFLGSAQYPFSNLPGILDLDKYGDTDGVSIDYQWVGTNDNTGSFNSRGRTLTHEIGHFLGLRHIWGDSNSCGADDFCDDTPAMSGSNSGKSTPCSFPGRNSCTDEEDDLPDMFQNFMDYTDDECMNLFTVCQKNRMRTVLEFSPRRASLLTSRALNEPVSVANDMGIKSIVSPARSNCSNVVIPRVEVRNYGSNPVTSFQIQLYLNGDLIESLTHTTPVQPLGLRIINFSTLTIPADQENEITFSIVQVNGSEDENDLNNSREISLPTVQSQLVPYFESFENNTASGVFRTTENKSNSLWAFAYESAVLPLYNQTENFGVQDMLLTNVFDLSSLTSAELTFRYAYAPRSGGDFRDGLIVAVSTNCGQDFFTQDYLFQAHASSLGTAPTNNSDFIPEYASDWNNVTINLTNYTGYENIQIAFIGVNGGGNNIYIDDINITSANLLGYDAGLQSISTLPVVSCNGAFSPYIEVKNFGFEKIESLTVQMDVNGVVQDSTFTDLRLLSGFSDRFRLPLPEPLNEGIHHISIQINSVNGVADEQPSNNTANYQVIINSDSETIPVLENFDDATWTKTSPSGNSIFEETFLNGTDVLAGKAHEAPDMGSMSYLVSPVLNTSSYTEAAIRFKYSYAERTGYNDNLKVLLSFNCGSSFGTEVLNLNSEQLAVATSNLAWAPSTDSDWKTAFIDISEYLIWDEIRIAIVFTNGNGNNIYLDDIEVVTTADPNQPEFEDLMVVYPNPTSQGSFNVALNLFGKQDVEIRLIDMSGKIVLSQLFPGSLNQTYHFIAPSQGGAYLVQMLGSDGVLNQVKRLYIRQ